ncbi:(2S)-3-sulfopropanediol dehydratase activating enzyme [Desulfocurvus sp. DL9XJH121]
MANIPDKSVTGTVFNIQKYSVHDGPGIRTIVFIKGCSLRCKWCSNPESQILEPEIAVNPNKCLTVDKCKRCLDVCPNQALGFNEDGIVVRLPEACRQCLTCAEHCPTHALNVYGETMTVDKALSRVEEDGIFYARSGGGLTLSGGEPLLQSEFALALLREAKRRRLHTCIETCGNVPWHVLDEAANYLDTIFFDVKSVDEAVHKEATGGSCAPILDNLKKLVAAHPDKSVTVRTPVIPGINDTKESIAAIAALVRTLPGVQYELLAYHRMGTPKYAYIGRDYPMGDTPNLDDEHFNELLETARQGVETATACNEVEVSS